MARFVNDATACFDQIIPNISTLVARKYGMEPNVMITYNLVIADMEHSLHTKHGNFSYTYRDKISDIKMAGKTQDTGSTCCLWSIKSHMILRAHQELHKVINLPHVNGTRRIKKNNIVFVDDANSKAAKEGDTFHLSELKTVAHLEKGAQLWAKIISATGGAIAHHKSVSKIISWWDHM